jgi:hypothetical protein
MRLSRLFDIVRGAQALNNNILHGRRPSAAAMKQLGLPDGIAKRWKR